MASVCVNNMSISPEKFLDRPPTKSDLEFSVDFEFRLEDPVNMLPADELFSNGKLVPLQLSTFRPSITTSDPATPYHKLPDTPHFLKRNDISAMDPYLFSPKAPTCSIRWKELLGLKKLYQKPEDVKPASSPTQSNKNAARSLKNLLNRSSKSSLNTSIDSSFSLPLLKISDNDTEPISISSRHSLSSSSSGGHEHDDLPRLSLDTDKPNKTTTNNLPRVRVSKLKNRAPENQAANLRTSRNSLRRTPEAVAPPPVHDVTVDSPRMNSSGKIVFQSLERSSSSPSTFNGGPRYKHRGVERSYSAKVRITPVLNVPVCSLRGSSKSGGFGFPLFSSSTQPKKDNHHVSSNIGGSSRSQQVNSKNRVDRA